jgi:hypothetical protein
MGAEGPDQPASPDEQQKMTSKSRWSFLKALA